MNVWCFYHGSDCDGHCSGAIVREWCRRLGHTFTPRGVDYGRPVDWLEGAGGGALAVICDFTPEGDAPLAELLRVRDAYGRGLLWFDHHATAIERVGPDADGGVVRGYRETGVAACALVWSGLFCEWPAPVAVRLLADYDVFDRRDSERWEREILPFQYGMRMRETDPATESSVRLWESLLSGDDLSGGLEGVIMSDGAAALAYERREQRRAAGAAYDCIFDGLLCCAMNGSGNSLALDSAVRPEHKLCALWRHVGARRAWRVSLYENGHADVDCGALAALHGGGGHRGAAGFEFPDDVSPLEFFEPLEGRAVE